MRSTTHPPRLSRELILESALRLADEQGLDTLSMRRLAAALGVEAMSLYNHVPSKAALLSGMLERLLATLELSTDPGLPWRERLRRAAVSFFTTAAAHPSLIELLTSQHIHTGNVLAPTEAVLGIFRQAGFADAEATLAYQSLIGYVLGFILQQHKGTIGVSCCGTATAIGTGAGAGAGDHTLHSAEAFEFGLTVVLDGLEAKLRR